MIPTPMSGKPYYITTAIAYPNGAPHIGHAYEAIATDAIARFMRLDGRDVFFLTGTDEHGIKMLQTAAKENVTPRELVERNVPRFQAMVKRFNCSNDEFIRTTEARHHRSSEAIWQRMQAAGDIYLDKYAGWYSVRDEAYYDESETRLDDKGVRLGPQGTPVEWVEEESYFFKLSAFAERLLDLYKRVPDFVLPRERMNEVASFVRGGLKDLSLSRTTFDWGIKVPANPKHIMYVWVDALTNYITAVGYPDTDSAMFKKYWPADLHVIGKDIVRFHAVYWPAFLMSAGVEVPRRIFSHGFLFNRGEKMSKSVGNVIDPFALADAYGVDPLRYFPLARSAVRPGRQLQPRGHRQSHQCRSRQRSRQSGAAFAHHGRAQSRRHTAGAGRLQRQRPGDLERGRRHGLQGARRHGDAATAPGAQCGLGGGGRRQSLFRRRSALGARQDRSAAAGHRVVCDRRGVAADRDPGAAVHAGIGGQAARSSGDTGWRAHVRLSRRQTSHRSRRKAAGAGGGISALCRA